MAVVALVVAVAVAIVVLLVLGVVGLGETAGGGAVV